VSKLRELKPQLLQDGIDMRIDSAEWNRIRGLLPDRNELCKDDLVVLVEIRSTARSVCPSFDDYFFPALKAHLLADGTISKMEQFQLLRMLYGGGGIDQAERQFLQELRNDLREVDPEFEAMYRQVMRD